MIELKNLSVALDEFRLEDVSLNIEKGEYFILLGPTGAGKTVLLEAIAGLHPLSSGRVCLNGRDVTHLSPDKRNIGIAYQDYALFPHLTVAQNIGFGLKHRGRPPAEVRSAATKLADLFGIGHLMERKPQTLSGGESQRVALARALAIEPELLLLDEPLSALDPEKREAAQRELRRIHEHLKVTTIHVTHDFEEAAALGDRIAVLGEGRMLQVGTPQQVFRQPNSEFVARFALSRNIFEGEVRDGVDGQAVIHLGGAALAVVTGLRGRLHASIRPEDILISTEPLRSSAQNCLKGTISHVADKGSVVYLTIGVPPDFTCLVTHRSYREMGLGSGKEVYITFKASAVHIF